MNSIYLRVTLQNGMLCVESPDGKTMLLSGQKHKDILLKLIQLERAAERNALSDDFAQDQSIPLAAQTQAFLTTGGKVDKCLPNQKPVSKEVAAALKDLPELDLTALGL